MVRAAAVLVARPAVPLESLTEARRRNLDRHVTPKTGIAGLIHLALVALADGRDDFIRAEFFTLLERHLSD
jgi:hypothetical protein